MFVFVPNACRQMCVSFLHLLVKHSPLQLPCCLFSSPVETFLEYRRICSKRIFYRLSNSYCNSVNCCYKKEIVQVYRKLWTMECIKFAQGWEVVYTKTSCSKLLVTKCLLSKIFDFSKELMKYILVHGYFMISLNLWQIQCHLSYFQWSKWKMKKSNLYSQRDKMFL